MQRTLLLLVSMLAAVAALAPAPQSRVVPQVKAQVKPEIMAAAAFAPLAAAAPALAYNSDVVPEFLPAILVPLTTLFVPFAVMATAFVSTQKTFEE